MKIIKTLFISNVLTIIISVVRWNLYGEKWIQKMLFFAMPFYVTTILYLCLYISLFLLIVNNIYDRLKKRYTLNSIDIISIILVTIVFSVVTSIYLYDIRAILNENILGLVKRIKNLLALTFILVGIVNWYKYNGRYGIPTIMSGALFLYTNELTLSFLSDFWLNI